MNRSITSFFSSEQIKWSSPNSSFCTKKRSSPKLEQFFPPNSGEDQRKKRSSPELEQFKQKFPQTAQHAHPNFPYPCSSFKVVAFFGNQPRPWRKVDQIVAMTFFWRSTENLVKTRPAQKFWSLHKQILPPLEQCSSCGTDMWVKTTCASRHWQLLMIFQTSCTYLFNCFFGRFAKWQIFLTVVGNHLHSNSLLSFA